MAEQILFQVRIDKELKENVADIYSKLGMDLPTAVRMFFVKSKMENGLPFNATLPGKQITSEEAIKAFEGLRNDAATVPVMSLHEINEEIGKARKEKKSEKNSKPGKQSRRVKTL